MALSPDTIQEYFDKNSKCKTSWELIKATKIWKNDWCVQDIELILKNENWYFKTIWTYNNWECILDTFYEQFFENDAKIWNQYNFILDEKYNILIKWWNIENIETCVWNKITFDENINTQKYFIFGILIILILIIWIIFFKIKTKKQS